MLTPLLATPARAQWPDDRVVRIVVPFGGGATDFLGRALASELGKRLKQNVIVENRAGAGGSVGAQAVALSPADGYTLLLASGSMFTVNQFIYGKLPYSLDNFSLVGKVASGPMVVTVNAGLPVKNIRELIAYAQARPGKLNSLLPAWAARRTWRARPSATRRASSWCTYPTRAKGRPIRT